MGRRPLAECRLAEQWADLGWLGEPADRLATSHDRWCGATRRRGQRRSGDRCGLGTVGSRSKSTLLDLRRPSHRTPTPAPHRAAPLRRGVDLRGIGHGDRRSIDQRGRGGSDAASVGGALPPRDRDQRPSVLATPAGGAARRGRCVPDTAIGGHLATRGGARRGWPAAADGLLPGASTAHANPTPHGHPSRSAAGRTLDGESALLSGYWSRRRPPDWRCRSLARRPAVPIASPVSILRSLTGWPKAGDRHGVGRRDCSGRSYSARRRADFGG